MNDEIKRYKRSKINCRQYRENNVGGDVIWRYKDPTEILKEAVDQLHLKTTDGYLIDGKDPIYIGPRYKNDIAPLPDKIGNFGVTVTWQKSYLGDGGGWPGSKKYEYLAILRVEGTNQTAKKAFQVIYVP